MPEQTQNAVPPDPEHTPAIGASSSPESTDEATGGGGREARKTLQRDGKARRRLQIELRGMRRLELAYTATAYALVLPLIVGLAVCVVLTAWSMGVAVVPLSENTKEANGRREKQAGNEGRQTRVDRVKEKLLDLDIERDAILRMLGELSRKPKAASPASQSQTSQSPAARPAAAPPAAGPAAAPSPGDIEPEESEGAG